jgi:hypothetical protein
MNGASLNNGDSATKVLIAIAQLEGANQAA